MLKPWLTFVSEHGKSEKILDALEVVKLLPTLKNVINPQHPKFHRIMNVALSESEARFHLFFFFFFFFFLAPDC